MEDKEIKKLRAEKTALVEKLVSIYHAYFGVIEFGGAHLPALNKAIEDSMDIDMKIILDLAKKRGAKNKL